ncbi:MAG TPA: peptidylprolyl isomerase, partial [Polyangiaceae bacterium]|nr:peptidylprolyl isomerase [Polyangiaceae bacterium]
ILVKRILPGSTANEVQAVVNLANTLAHQAQSGADFCKLVEQYSDDPSTRSSCGSRGPQPFKDLFPPIQQLVQTVKSGQVSDAERVHIGQDELMVIAMPLPQSRVPTYEEVKNEMMQRALLEGLERAHKQWLEELRHNVYIDVRL